jgi:hypothetical protein
MPALKIIIKSFEEEILKIFKVTSSLISTAHWSYLHVMQQILAQEEECSAVDKPFDRQMF